MKRITLAGMALVSCLSAVSLAFGDDDLAQCAEIEDDANRLACYDRSFSRQAVVTEADEAPAPPEAAPDPVVEPQAPVAESPPPEAATPVEEPAPATIVEERPPATTQTKAAAGSTAAAAAAASEAESFGLPPVPAPDPDQPGSGEITAVVTEITRRPLGEHVIVLDNGQVWQQQTKTSYFPVKPSETVTIRKRRFSGYLLVTPSGRGYSVKRVQ